MDIFSNQVWVCGEVLIDLIPFEDSTRAVVGGGPANTAVALAKLGTRVQFIDGISTDEYGQMALNHLRDEGVLLDLVNISEKPTSLAAITLNKQGGATYEFLTKGTATFDFSFSWLPDPFHYKPLILHIGTLATVIEPSASVLYKWAKQVAEVAPIVFDPNIRPAVLTNRDQYLSQVEKWIKISSLVKVSNDDINWLFPGKKIDIVIEKWLSLGPKLIIVTFGDKGLAGYRNGEKVCVGAQKVIVADTVGAGDTVGAILVEAIIEIGLDNLIKEKLVSILNRAARAAAITVSRIGAVPPSKFEI